MQTKFCNICSKTKPVTEFNKKSAGKDGLSTDCKLCHRDLSKKWRAANPDRIAEVSKKWRDENGERKSAMNKAWRDANQQRVIEVKKDWNAANKDRNRTVNKAWRTNNPERCSEYVKAWAAANPEKFLAKSQKWIEANPHKLNAQSARRRVAKSSATPPWAIQSEIECFYKEAKRLEKETGIKYHVDHIIPLRGRLVSGLHVANNLQVLTATENLKKKNSFTI